MQEKNCGVENMIDNYDLLSDVMKDTHLNSIGGNWFTGACPFCGGKDRFVLKNTQNGWRWYCRGCGDSKYHSSIDYIMKRDGINYRDALKKALGRNAHSPSKKVSYVPTSDKELANLEIWQIQAKKKTHDFQEELWGIEGEAAREYLHLRGLADKIIRDYQLGYLSTDLYEENEKWGFGIEMNQQGYERKVWLPKGIVIPTIENDIVTGLKIRVLGSLTQHKYIKVKGSKSGVFGNQFFTGKDICILTEGEFDAMLLNQETQNRYAVGSLGSATNLLNGLDFAIWGKYFIPMMNIYVVFDSDAAGNKGSEALAGFSERISRINLPIIPDVKDITDFYLVGGDLQNWLANEINVKKGI